MSKSTSASALPGTGGSYTRTTTGDLQQTQATKPQTPAPKPATKAEEKEA